MTKKEAKIEALNQIWGWATFLCEGVEDGVFKEFSGNMNTDIQMGRYTEDEAIMVQMELYKESERIIRRSIKLRQNIKHLTKLK